MKRITLIAFLALTTITFLAAIVEPENDKTYTLKWEKIDGKPTNFKVKGKKVVVEYTKISDDKTIVVYVDEHDANFIINDFDAIKDGDKKSTKSSYNYLHLYMMSYGNEEYTLVYKGKEIRQSCYRVFSERKSVIIGVPELKSNFLFVGAFNSNYINKLHTIPFKLSSLVCVKTNEKKATFFYKGDQISQNDGLKFVTCNGSNDLVIYNPPDNATHVCTGFITRPADMYASCLDLNASRNEDYIVWKRLKPDFVCIVKNGSPVSNDFTVSRVDSQKSLATAKNGDKYYLYNDKVGTKWQKSTKAN